MELHAPFDLEAVLRPLPSHAATRFRRVLLSVYLYNEHRGYTQLEALQAALQKARPDQLALIEAIRSHAQDERRHYRMFRAWFRRHGTMPLQIDARTGYIDRLVRGVTGDALEHVRLDDAVRDDASLQRLLRLIVLTERRGLLQVRSLLRLGSVLLDRDTRAMFEIVERDEPSHFEPYQQWLAAQGGGAPTPRERLADLRTHLSIVGLRVPQLLCNLHAPTLDAFPA